MAADTVLIHGVPFVGWSDAPPMEDCGVSVNPSIPACDLMISKYWADEPVRSAAPEDTPYPPPDHDTWQSTDGNAESIEDIKKPLDDGFPVLVFSGLTPVGHSWGMPALPVSGPFSAQKFGPRSDLLGFIAPYEMFEALMPRLLNEVVTMTQRVVIGYDDQQQTIYLHDPSFGPAWQVPYEWFELMWQPFNRAYVVKHPTDAASRLAGRPQAAPYRARTTDERAAFGYVMAYALSCVQQRQEARQLLEKTLQLPELSPGYRHVIRIEMAVQAMYENDNATASKLLREAAALIPKHSLPWRMLLEIYRTAPELGGLVATLKATYRHWNSSREWARMMAVRSLPSNIMLFPGGTSHVGFHPPESETAAAKTETVS